MPSYYDVDEILAEEELISCQTTFDFSYLSHLNPDAALYMNDRTNNGSSKYKMPKHVLPKDAILKLPIWAVRGWLDVSYVYIRCIPTPYNLKAREWLSADPVSVDTLAPRFFEAGRALLHLMEQSSYKQAQTWKSQPTSRDRSQRMKKLDDLLQECSQLRHTLLKTYTGDRLRATMNWALSSVGDDVSSYVHQLTHVERRLYRRAAVAAHNFSVWKQRHANTTGSRVHAQQVVVGRRQSVNRHQAVSSSSERSSSLTREREEGPDPNDRTKRVRQL